MWTNIDTFLQTHLQNVFIGLVTQYSNALSHVNQGRDNHVDTFIDMFTDIVTFSSDILMRILHAEQSACMGTYLFRVY